MFPYFSRPFATFAAHVTQEADQFKEQVAVLRPQDLKLKQKMVQMCYFKGWKDPDSKLSVTLGLSNQFEDLTFYTLPDPYGFNNTNNFYMVTEVIKANVDFKSLSAEKQKAIFKVFSAAGNAVQFVPVPGKENNGILDLMGYDFVQAGLTANKLAESITTIHKACQEWTKRLDAILKSSDEIVVNTTQATLNEIPNSSLADTFVLSDTTACETPQLIYNNQKSFAKAVSLRVNYWKKISDNALTTYPSRYGMLANPIYASQMAPKYQYNPQRNTARVGWDSSLPEVLQLRAFTEVTLSNLFLFNGAVTFEDLTKRYPKYLERLNTIVQASAVFDGVRMYGPNQLNDNSFWMEDYNTILSNSWYFEVYRNIQLRTGLDEVNLLVSLCEKVRIIVPSLPHYKMPVNVSDPKKAESESIISAQKQVVMTQQSDFAMTFMNLYSEFMGSISDLKLLSLVPNDWEVQVFNFDMYHDQNKIRAYNHYENGQTYRYPEVTRTLVMPLDYAAFSQEEQDRLQSFLVTYNAQNNPSGWAIQMKEAQDEKASLMKKIRFDFYFRGSNLSGDINKNAMDLDQSLTSFNENFPIIQSQLLATLPPHAKASVEDVEFNFAVIKKPTEAVNETGIAALTKAFNSIPIPMNSEMSFSLMHNQHNLERSYSLSYSSGSSQYLLQGTLLNPVPFSGMAKKLQNNLRKFCAAHSNINMSLVNNYGQLFTIFGMPINVSMVAGRRIDLYDSDHSIEKKIKKFKKEFKNIKFN